METHLFWLVFVVRLDAFNISKGVHTTNHPSKDGVLAVQVCAASVGYKELHARTNERYTHDDNG